MSEFDKLLVKDESEIFGEQNFRYSCGKLSGFFMGLDWADKISEDCSIPYEVRELVRYVENVRKDYDSKCALVDKLRREMLTCTCKE